MHSELSNTKVNLIPNLFSLLLFFPLDPSTGRFPHSVSRSACLQSTTISKPWSWSDITLRFWDLTEVWVIGVQSRWLCQRLYFLLYASAIWELIEFYLSSVLLFSTQFRSEERGGQPGANLGLQRDYCLLIYLQLNFSLVIFTASVTPSLQLSDRQKEKENMMF